MWEALVAVGTLVLGAATFGLGWYTRKLARTSADDLQAQWRPIILPVPFGEPTARENVAYDEVEGVLRVQVHNAGRGPALFLRAVVDPRGDPDERGPVAALAAGEGRLFMFNRVKNERQQAQILLDYRDLAGRPYSTSITIDLQRRAFYDVQVFSHFTTGQDDAVYPQPGLRDARNASAPLKARLGGAIRALRGKPPPAPK
jgi:hypothetical protein